MMYWLLQPVAFIIEGVVWFYWGKLRKRLDGRVGYETLNTFERLVGYGWACMWLMWGAPKRDFALLTCT